MEVMPVYSPLRFLAAQLARHLLRQARQGVPHGSLGDALGRRIKRACLDCCRV